MTKYEISSVGWCREREGERATQRKEDKEVNSIGKNER